MENNLKMYDNTRLSAYKDCPRMFYYRHIRHWKSGGPAPALIFGGSWHAAMDVVWTMLAAGETDAYKVTEEAMKTFLAHWESEGMPPPSEIDYELEKQLSPRTPGIALEMLSAYVTTRMQAINHDFDLVDCERPFAVPLDPHDESLVYIGKIDKVVLRGKKVGGIEHKTSSAYAKNGMFRSIFLDSFSPNSQVDGYLYALHLMFPNQVFGVWVDAALVHKTEQGFQFIPVERQLKQLDLWLWETKQWISKVEEDKRRLEGCSPDEAYMAAFPKNTNSCFNFNRACPYMSICKAWPNPVGKDIPLGFEEEVWNPLDHIDADRIERLEKKDA